MRESLLLRRNLNKKMAEEDDYDLESRPSRPVSAMAIEFEPDLEAPLLASVGTKPQSRLAPLLVLFGQFQNLCKIPTDVISHGWNPSRVSERNRMW